ncbi:hypothetical protein B0O99DRAFT_521715 [Bisporella sp. PMI_857]|nr:hypothetical protein B0O99DRAFT_521715 [Bisporella sp. PMI_857]
MFEALLDRVEAMPEDMSAAEVMRAPSADSGQGSIVVDDFDGPFSNAQSSSSTPPTSHGDSASISSASLKLDEPSTGSNIDSGRRSGRNRDSITTYNIKVLAGTAIHAPKKYSKIGDGEVETRRRTISGDTLVDGLASVNASTETVQEDARKLVSAGIDALDLNWSVKKLPKSRSQLELRGSPKRNQNAKQKDLDRRKSARSTGEKIEILTGKLASGKRKLDDGLSRATRELRRLADTPEFAKIDMKPVIHEVWSNGKLVVEEPPAKRRKREAAEAAAAAKAKEEAEKAEALKIAEAASAKERPNQKKRKIWLTKGLYAGQQTMSLDWFKDWPGAEKKKLQEMAPYKPNGALPLPMWHGQRLLHVGRHFKLPFDVCSPLPPGQPKPDEWKKTSTNRFIGEAGALWKKTKLFDSFSSKCVCTPEGGCDVDCQNRIMLYECDDTNCGAGRGHCTNRAFADLAERRKGGGKYRIGVEVIKTLDRGYGVRSNRCFEPHQIIVEYTGEIITEDECDRRMNEEYKDNECYYLMSFDQNMIIDATKGSIARFVNHSCKPNSRMVKWIVGGKPRMALFAGDNPIMSGDELTYDYNFDPFSAKNVQECRCGSDNCRGVLGPKPKDPKPIKEAIKDTVKGAGKAVKRKISQMLGGEDDSDVKSPKKRKIKEAKGIKRSASSASLAISKGANAVRRTVLNARQAVTSKKGSPTTKNIVKASSLKYSGRQVRATPKKSSLISNSPRSQKSIISKKGGSVTKNIVRKTYGRKSGPRLQAASESTIRVVSTPEPEESDQ